MIFAPIVTALSPALTGGKNAGFYRQDAQLAIIIISDAEDQSPKNLGPVETWNFLYNLKNRRADQIIGFGVIVPVLDNRNCNRDDFAMRPYRLEEFLKLIGRGQQNIYNLCDPQFGDNLLAVTDALIKSVANVIYLSRLPVPHTIQVIYGTQVIPSDPINGWSYDPSRNAVVFGKEMKLTDQPAGTKVRVIYDAAKL